MPQYLSMEWSKSAIIQDENQRVMLLYSKQLSSLAKIIMSHAQQQQLQG